MFDIPVNKTVANKRTFQKVVDTSFNTFTPTPQDIGVTVEQFFSEYENLFFEIPVEGEFNSHEYLAKRSGEISNFQATTTEIQPLLDEISNLRDQLLSANLRIVELETVRQQ